jgi:hypothetical protein
MPDLSDSDREFLSALQRESPWRWSNGIVERAVSERFENLFAILDRLQEHGLVAYEFYGTGAVHEYSITEAGQRYLTG